VLLFSESDFSTPKASVPWPMIDAHTIKQRLNHRFFNVLTSRMGDTGGEWNCPQPE
jgi:hypothetical protein